VELDKWDLFILPCLIEFRSGCEWTELNNNSEGQFKKNFQVEKRLVIEISFLHFSFELLYSFKFITW